MRQMVIDVAELNGSGLEYLNISCYYDTDVPREDHCAKFRLCSGDGVMMHQWQGESPTPKYAVDYLSNWYQTDSYYIVDSSGKKSVDELNTFIAEYDLADKNFVVGQAPEIKDVPTRVCDYLNEVSTKAVPNRRLPEPLSFKKGQLAWFPDMIDNEPIKGYMEEMYPKGVKLRTGPDEFHVAPLDECWRTKKQCQDFIDSKGMVPLDDALHSLGQQKETAYQQ